METCGWQLAVTIIHTYIHKDKVIASATRDRFPFMYFFHFNHQTCSRYSFPPLQSYSSYPYRHHIPRTLPHPSHVYATWTLTPLKRLAMGEYKYATS